MNEIQIVVNQQPGEIRFNYEDIKSMLQERLDFYKGAVVTEEGKTIAKKEVAALRKLKKEIDDRKKAVKREWNEPYEAFSAKVMELLSMIDEPIHLIDSQVKAFDEKQKEEKRAKIRKLYEELAGDVKEFLPLDKIYQNSWENVSTSMKKVQEEMKAKLDAVRRDLAAISSMQSEAVEKAVEIYKSSLDAMEAIRYINQYERQKQEILERERRKKEAEEERRRQAEIERIRREERERAAEEERIRKEAEEKARAEALARAAAEQPVLEVPEEVPEIEDDELPFEQPSTKTVLYKVVATEEELEQVEMALNSIGVSFARRDAS